MYNFIFDIPTRILFGEKQLDNLYKEKFFGKKALIVISNGNSAKKYGYLSRLEGQLDLAGIEHVTFDRVRQNPTNKNVEEGTKFAKDNECDFVIALGGGSVMDCAKCIALMMTNTGDLWDYSFSKRGRKKVAEHDAAPIVCITTTAGSGSEITYAAVISHDEYQEKSSIYFRSMYPKLSVVDSELMLSVPAKYTAFQGMDTFFHAAETILHTNNNPFAETMAFQTVKYVSEYLPKAFQNGNDREARGYLALANTFTGYNIMCTSLHSMEHAMGSFVPDLIHGAGLIMLSRAYFKYFIERNAAENKFIRLAKAMGIKNANSSYDFLSAYDNLLMQLECNDLKMSELNISKSDLIKFTEKIPDICGGDDNANPLPLDSKDYLKIYEASYK